MASAIGVRLVRCPKCEKLLTEFAQVPIYRCGGCSTLLRVKAHVSIGASESLENVSTNLASEVADGEEEVAQPGHRHASSSNAAHDSSNGKEEVVAENGGINAHVIAENLSVDDDEEEEEEEETEKSLQDPQDDIKSTSLAYDGGSSSSGDEQQEAHATHKRPPVSKRSCGHNKASSTDSTTTTAKLGRDAATLGSDDFYSVQNWMGSEIDDDHLITLSKDLLLRAGSDRSEPDPLEILRKVDELRDELGELLARTKGGGRASGAFRPRIAQPPLSEKPSHARGGAKKQPAVKRYYRPVRGGAPFVVCYQCWKLLQLPADFLVSSGKTLHKLRCGACSEVLVFSFRPRVLGTDQHHSRSESYSSEPEPEPEPEPVHNVSRSSSYSAKKLHRLMGYSSASDVLFRSGGRVVDGGYESSETSTPPRVERRRYGAGTSTSKSAEKQEVVEGSHERVASTPRRRRGSA